MSLTNEDLLAISQLLDTKLDARLKPIENDIRSIRDEQVLMKDEQRRLWDEQVLMKDEQRRLWDGQKALQDGQKALQDGQKALWEGQKELQEEQKALWKGQKELQEEQKRINLIIENDILHGINILVENYVPAAKRYEKAVDRMDAMQADIDIIKKVLADHSEKLKKIS